MRLLRRFVVRLSNLATGRSADERLQEEVAEHLTFQTEENLRAGMSPAEARRQAALKLGATESIREHLHAEQSLPVIENLLFDLRYAVRMLLRSPGFSFIAIATMALGIGATTAIYSVIDATLLHPLPFPNPSELVRIQDDLPGVGAQGVGISVPEWRDLESSGIFQAAAITGTGANVNLTGSAQPLRLSFKQVTPNYFAVLGVDAQLGRTFNANDATPGYNLEVVLSDGLWRREFGADPHILGKAVRLDNDVYHVVGVMPRGFRDQGSTSDEQSVELWLGAGFAGVPFPPPLREFTFEQSCCHRAPEAGTLDGGSAGASGCAGEIVEKAISGGVSGTNRMDGSPDSAQRNRCWQRSPISHSVVRRGRIGPSDQLRECRQSPARQDQCEES